MTSYTSKDEWDTSISSVGGKKDVCLVVSPWSHNPSANPAQGILTHGVLINQYEPPEILIEPATDGYFYQDRLDMSRVNERANTVEGGGVSDEKLGRKEDFYVAPSRRAYKTALKPKREEKEGYNPGIPGLVDSNIHQENFTQEETNNIVVILLSVIAICIIGVSFGILIPQVYVSIMNKGGSKLF